MAFSKPSGKPKPKPAAVTRKGTMRAGNYRVCPGCTRGMVNGMRHAPCRGTGLIAR